MKTFYTSLTLFFAVIFFLLFNNVALYTKQCYTSPLWMDLRKNEASLSQHCMSCASIHTYTQTHTHTYIYAYKKKSIKCNKTASKEIRALNFNRDVQTHTHTHAMEINHQKKCAME